MQVVYALEEPPISYSKSIFLAGPTPRSAEVQGWRRDALLELERLGYDGVVFVPESINQEWHNDYLGQIEWEQKSRARADVIAFWVPRNATTMPGLTTNIEFGEDFSSMKIVYGRPLNAESFNYLDALYEKAYKKQPAHTLKSTMQRAIEFIGEGAPRVKGETTVPLHIWRTRQFQKWYLAQTHVGNKLVDCKQLNVFVPRSTDFVFMFQLWVRVWIAAEQRYKENEFIVSRTDISVICAYYREPGDHLLDAKIVLVKEFRSPVRNPKGFVYELAGGSSFKKTEDIMQTAVDELFEETGLQVSIDQLEFKGGRQLNATFTTHHAHLFTCALTREQLEIALEAESLNKTFGNIEDSELTYIRVARVSDILNNREAYPVDWSMLGMIVEALS